MLFINSSLLPPQNHFTLCPFLYHLVKSPLMGNTKPWLYSGCRSPRPLRPPFTAINRLQPLYRAITCAQFPSYRQQTPCVSVPRALYARPATAAPTHPVGSPQTRNVAGDWHKKGYIVAETDGETLWYYREREGGEEQREVMPTTNDGERKRVGGT